MIALFLGKSVQQSLFQQLVHIFIIICFFPEDMFVTVSPCIKELLFKFFLLFCRTIFTVYFLEDFENIHAFSG